jgi:drug/metabolite transporter (DMT)-like permease
MSRPPASDTLRAIGLMVLSMAGFATADSFIKLSADHLPASQVLTALGIGGTVVFASISLVRGVPLISKRIIHPAVLSRGVAEIVATCGFLMALTLLDFSVASSILQVAPLIVTLGAAVLLREAVSWRRWSAVIAGLIGVLIILNPTGTDTNLLQANPTGAILALIGVTGLAGRDLATRFIPKDVPNLQAATWGFVTVILAGCILVLFGDPWVWPTPLTWVYLGALIAFACIGYFAITAAMRIGDVSAVAPFRYSRIVFAFILSVALFGETLTPRILIGAAIIVSAGLYVWLRERNRAAPLQSTQQSR